MTFNKIMFSTGITFLQKFSLIAATTTNRERSLRHQLMAVVQCTLNSWKYCAMPKFPTSQKLSSMIKIRINRKRKYESIILGRRRCSQQRGVLWRARGESWLHLWLQHYRSTSKEMHWQPSRNMWADLCQGYLSNITQGSCIGLQRKKLFLSVVI